MMAGSEPLVSIVISNLNGGERLITCLNSLVAQRYANVEVVVVDNGSDDDSVELVERFHRGVKLIRSKRNLGFAGGGNLGASYCSGEYLLFLNHDMEFDPAFIRELVDVMAKDLGIGIAQAKILSSIDHHVVDSAGSFFTSTGFVLHRAQCPSTLSNSEDLQEIFGAAGGASIVRRSLYDKLGGFDGDYVIYAEDIDFSWRAWLTGYKVVLVPKAIIYHLGGHTTRRMPPSFVVYHTFKNRLCTLIKNLTPGQMFKVLPIHLAICFAAATLFVLKLKISNGWAIVRAIGWNIVNVKRSFKKRKEIDRIANVDRSELLSRLERRMPLMYLVNAGTKYVRSW